MGISLQTFGDASSGSPVTGSVTFNNVGNALIQAGDTLILGITARDSRVTVSSVTDNYGNTWASIPGSRATAGDYDAGGPIFGAGSFSELWIAKNVAAVGGTNLAVTVDLTGGAAAIAGVVLWDLTGVPHGSTVADVGQNSANTNSGGTVSGPELSANSAAVFLAMLSALGAASASVSSPFSHLDGMISPGVVFASVTEAASASATPSFGLSFNTPWAISAAAIVAASGGGTGILANYSVGDTISDDDIASIAPAGVDRGHISYPTVYSGTLRNWDGQIGILFADAEQGDSTLPKLVQGEGPLVRVQLRDVTYSPNVGDRVKFLLYRTSAGDKLAKAVSLIS